jgi:predicted nucleic acid-binding protein
VNQVFLDTVGIIAILDQDDQWHAAAVSAYEHVRASGLQPVTTPHLLWESGNAASRRPYRRDIAELREKMAEAERILHVSDADEEAAWMAYVAGTAGEAGVVDHISFVVMNKFGIQRAFTNDRHFQAVGFETLF